MRRVVTFAVRSDRAGTEGFLSEVRHVIWSVNSSLPVASPRTMQDVYSRSLALTSFTLTMLVIAGGMALLLGIIGIYGVISYGVSQRRREIGLRLALGAAHGELRSMFVRHGLALVGAGAIAGLAVPVVLGLAAVLASYLPARRASLVDPAETLRME